MKAKTALGLAVLGFGLESNGLCHSGRTDSQGGHYNHRTGEYHFHGKLISGFQQVAEEPGFIQRHPFLTTIVGVLVFLRGVSAWDDWRNKRVLAKMDREDRSKNVPPSAPPTKPD